MSEDPTPYRHEERAPDTSGKSLGQIAYEAHSPYDEASPVNPMPWDNFTGPYDHLHREAWEAAAQAVRLHVLEEAERAILAEAERSPFFNELESAANIVRSLKSSKDAGS